MHFWIETGELWLIFEICFFMERCSKILSNFDIRISYAFIRLILPASFFEAVSCTKNVKYIYNKIEDEWQ